MRANKQEAPSNVISVTAAVIRRGDKVFIARRSAAIPGKKKPGDSIAGKWEFPGGKLEPGESPEQGLRRELREEFAVDSRIGRLLATTEHESSRGRIRLLFLEAELLSDHIVLKDHDSFEWAPVAGLDKHDLLPADLEFARSQWG